MIDSLFENTDHTAGHYIQNGLEGSIINIHLEVPKGVLKMPTGYGAIYRLSNEKINVHYFGQTINIQQRAYRYRTLKCEKQKKLHSHLNKYKSGWVMAILHIVKIEDLDKYENMYISQQLDNDWGYNVLNISRYANAPLRGVTGADHPWYGRTGDKHPMYGRTGYLSKSSRMVIDTISGEVYPCAMEIIRLGLYDKTRKNFTDMLNGVRRNTTRFRWLDSPESPVLQEKVNLSEVFKISNNRPEVKAKKMGEKNPKARLVLDTSTGVFYGCLKDACDSRMYPYPYDYVRCMLGGRNRNKTSLIYI